jgi:hypothetical protein
MANIIWQDRETGVYVVTHELYSRPARLIGVVMLLAAERSQWTTDELKAVITKYGALPGCTLQKNEDPSIITLCELEHLCPSLILSRGPGPLSLVWNAKKPV